LAEPYTISKHSLKVMGGASCRLERGNVGHRGLNHRVVLISNFRLGTQNHSPQILLVSFS
jgi:hypothetical protein